MFMYLFWGGGMWDPPLCARLCVNRVAYGNHVTYQIFHLPKGKSTVSLTDGALPGLPSEGGEYEGVVPPLNLNRHRGPMIIFPNK